ncbi:hypothetical protein BZA77DRAFT_172474 [Pyronema omphalodes]|nr:hypothetical protein BZA77DRAFT_172474 [Pyronema omphalodes]
MWKRQKGADRVVGVIERKVWERSKSPIRQPTKTKNQRTIFVTLLSPELSLISCLSPDLMANSYSFSIFLFASFALVVNNMLLVGGCDATTVGVNWMANGYVADVADNVQRPDLMQASVRASDFEISGNQTGLFIFGWLEQKVWLSSIREMGLPFIECFINAALRRGGTETAATEMQGMEIYEEEPYFL